MRVTTRHILVSLLLVHCLMFAVACAPASNDEGLETLHIVEVTRSPFYAPQYIAIQEGFFQEEGIQIELKGGSGGDKTMATLLSSDADIALVGAETAVYVTSRDAQNPVVGFAQMTQTDGSFLVSRKPADHFKWGDLKGKTMLGQRKGGMPQMVNEYVQRKNGLKPHQDVHIIQKVDFDNLGSAFLSGTGDYAQLFEPVASKIEQEGKGHVIASFGKHSGKLPYTVYLTRKDFLQEDEDLLKGFTRAIYKAQKWAYSHSPREIANSLQSFFPDTDQDILVKVLKRYQDQKSWAVDPVIHEKEYEKLLKIMNQAGELPDRVPYKEVIDTKIAKEVLTEIH